jgi:hypothetical protein
MGAASDGPAKIMRNKLRSQKECSPMDRELRVVIHFWWLKKRCNPAILLEPGNIYGHGVTVFNAMKKWTKGFNKEHIALNDYPKPERPS